MLGSDDLHSCLIGFHDPVYLLIFKVTKKFSDLFHTYLKQLGTYERDQTGNFLLDTQF